MMQNTESSAAGSPVVRCDVKNCQYHEQDGRCTAGKILVGPAYAVSNADTVCSTFKPARGQ